MISISLCENHGEYLNVFFLIIVDGRKLHFCYHKLCIWLCSARLLGNYMSLADHKSHEKALDLQRLDTRPIQ